MQRLAVISAAFCVFASAGVCHRMTDDGRNLEVLPAKLQHLSRRPTVLLFQVGLSCAHCFEQLEQFTRDLPLEEIHLVVILPEGLPHPSQIRDFSEIEFVSDPGGTCAQHYKLAGSGEQAMNLHATLVLNSAAQVVWQNIDEEPFMNAQEICGVLSGIKNAR